MPKFKIINDLDANDSFEVEASDLDDAAHEALCELNYWVSRDWSKNEDGKGEE